MRNTTGSKAYEIARERYAGMGIDTDTAIHQVSNIPLSLHCWQGDDVGGFETPDAVLSGGGIQVTGNYPGKARNPEELRSDIEKAFSLIPGVKRLNLHASYGEFNGNRIDRNEVEENHFSGWIDWAERHGCGLDFNATLFSHPKAADGYTLAHPDHAVRSFWIEHTARARKIGAAMGRALGNPCVFNTWIPDGAKDIPVDREAYRARLIDSLDTILKDRYEPDLLDAVEGKLFGIGSESFVAGSNDFYLAYAATRKILLTLDMGHFHPTENVADKISAVLPFLPGLLIHVSRGVRWDSDHVVIMNDELRELCLEIVRSGASEKIRIGLDFFDATINRIGAWCIGARSTRKALLESFLEPRKQLLAAEKSGDGFARLALLEEAKAMPWGSVWDELCEREDIPRDRDLIREVHGYERTVLAQRR